MVLCRYVYCVPVAYAVTYDILGSVTYTLHTLTGALDGTTTSHQLHWLLVRKRVDFKIATLVYRSLSGTAPAYLAADCQLSSEEGRRQLRSAISRTCVVTRQAVIQL